MRSRHVDHFNHDGEVHGYDEHVADESNPVRNGYSATLDWVIEQAAAGPADTVVDLGTGTGNLAQRFGPGRAARVCRRVERNVGRRAPQAPGRHRVRRGRPARVRRSRARVRRGHQHVRDPPSHRRREGRAPRRALRSPASRWPARDRRPDGRRRGSGRRAAARLAHADVDELFADEFPWYVDEARRDLDDVGFVAVRAEQTGVLSWGLAATKP